MTVDVNILITAEGLERLPVDFLIAGSLQETVAPSLALIRANGLVEAFGSSLDLSVGEKYLELRRAAQVSSDYQASS